MGIKHHGAHRNTCKMNFKNRKGCNAKHYKRVQSWKDFYILVPIEKLFLYHLGIPKSLCWRNRRTTLYALEKAHHPSLCPCLQTKSQKKTSTKFCMGSKMSKEDINKDAFICRLRFKEGLNTKSSESGLGSTDVVVGYKHKSTYGPLCNFVESITNSQ